MKQNINILSIIPFHSAAVYSWKHIGFVIWWEDLPIHLLKIIHYLQMWWKWNMNNCSFCHIFCSFPRPYYLSFWIHTSQRQESLARKTNVTTIQLPYYFPLTFILVSTDFLKIFLWFSNNFFITYIVTSYNFITAYLGISFL